MIEVKWDLELRLFIFKVKSWKIIAYRLIAMVFKLIKHEGLKL